MVFLVYVYVLKLWTSCMQFHFSRVYVHICVTWGFFFGLLERFIYLSLPSAISFLQSESLVVCDVAEDLVEKLRKFRFRKETNNAAIISKLKTCLTKIARSCRKSYLLFSFPCNVAAVTDKCEPRGCFLYGLQYFKFCL